MLQQFTWQQFLIAALVFTLVWYAGVILLFYRKELKDLLNGKGSVKPAREALPHRWESGVDALAEEDDELLGASKLPEGMSNVSMGSVGFMPDDQARAQQVGLVPDVLEEIKDVFAILEKEGGTKRDFFNLMAMVREKYAVIASNPNIGRINDFIAEHAPFHLSSEELDSLWD